MCKRTFIYPEDHWKMRVDIPYSMAVTQNDYFFTSGQADLSGNGNVQNPGDLNKQTLNAIGHIKNLLQAAKMTCHDLTKLVVYYIPEGETNESDYLEHIAGALDCPELPVITLVPISDFFYSGIRVEIDAYGKRIGSHTRSRFNPQNEIFPRAIQQNELIQVGGIKAINSSGEVLYPNDVVAQSKMTLEVLDDVLSHFGGNRFDIVKINNWYTGQDNAESWAESARIRAQYYPEPGPVATGLPLVQLIPSGCCIQTDAWIMIGQGGVPLEKRHSWPKNHWDWPIHLPFKHGLRCGDLAFIGGQVAMDKHANVLHPNDMPSQSMMSMHNKEKILLDLGLTWKDVIKMNAFYVGGTSPDDLHNNLNIRSGFFSKPGPASTGIPLKHLAYPGMLTEFESISIVPQD